METRIFEKLEKIEEKLGSIDTVLIRNTISLEEHMRRTLMNEEMIKEMRSDIKPIQEHRNHVIGAGKLLALIALLAGLFKMFTK